MRDRVAVIVVNWNGKQFLSKCLAGLRGQTYRHFSTILVDNGSTDGSVEFVKKHFPEVRIIALTENVGFAAANNVALKSVPTEFAALINNDAVARADWLQNLTNALDRYSQAGFAASKMVFFDDPTRIDRAGDGYTSAGAASLRGRGGSSRWYDQEEWVFGACAGAALYRMGMLKEIGLFDEDFFLLYEDVDLSFRAQLNGYRCLYVPNAIVYHMATKSIGHDSVTSVYYGHRNLEWTFIQNIPNRLILRTIGSHLLYILLAFFYFTIKGKGKIYLRAKKDALKGLRRSLRKRQYIQARRKVSGNYIRQLLSPENYGLRYSHHLHPKKKKIQW